LLVLSFESRPSFDMLGSTFSILLASLFSSAALAISNCSQVEQVEITFYGFPDNSPPGAGIACGIQSTGTCDSTCVNSNSSLTQIGSLFNYTTAPTSSCGPRGEKAGGSGSFDNPLTMASSGKWFCHLEVVYLPYLQKYLRYEDFCQQCIDDANAGKSVHIDIWTGSNATNGGQVQLQCEDSLTPGHQVDMIRNPPPDLPIDSMLLPVSV
jgi:hypothetical protein